MSVDDNWGEALRKSAIRLVADDGTEYKFRVDIDSKRYNAVETKSQTIGTTAVRLDLPDNSNEIEIRHDDAQTLWIGSDNSVAEDSGWPLYRREVLNFNLDKGNNNEIWAISSSGNINVFVIGVYKQ